MLQKFLYSTTKRLSMPFFIGLLLHIQFYTHIWHSKVMTALYLETLGPKLLGEINCQYDNNSAVQTSISMYLSITMEITTTPVVQTDVLNEPCCAWFIGLLTTDLWFLCAAVRIFFSKIVLKKTNCCITPLHPQLFNMYNSHLP